MRTLFAAAFITAIVFCTSGIQGQDFGDHNSSTLTTKAWNALGEGKFDLVQAYVNKCKELYGADALKQQAALKDFAPKDTAAKEWALNDVGTCYFIEGQMLEKQGKKKEAVEVYKKLVSDLKYCQCYDTKGWFWRPAEAAAGKIKQLEFDSKLD